jgi:hypothetical protein
MAEPGDSPTENAALTGNLFRVSKVSKKNVKKAGLLGRPWHVRQLAHGT